MERQLSAEQRKLRSTFRRFANERIAPRAAEFDEQETMPRPYIRHLAESGYLATRVPPKYGGRGLDLISYGLLHEEVGRFCSSTRTLLTVHDMVAEVIVRIGSEKLRRLWLPELASGRSLAAFALTEPEAGSDASAVRSTAIRNGEGYLLRGRKLWVSFGQVANLFLVVARIGEDGPLGGFLVNRDDPGLTIKPMQGLLGLRGSMLAELQLEGCAIRGDAQVGVAGMPSGLLVGTALHLGRYSVAWGCVGLGESCMQESFRYSAARNQFGVPLEQHQLIQRKLTNMVAEVHAARLLCLEAGHLQQARDVGAIRATLIAKYFASRMANRVASDAVQIHGARGVSNALPIERHFRDARIMEIIEGSREIQQITIAKHGSLE